MHFNALVHLEGQYHALMALHHDSEIVDHIGKCHGLVHHDGSDLQSIQELRLKAHTLLACPPWEAHRQRLTWMDELPFRCRLLNLIPKAGATSMDSISTAIT